MSISVTNPITDLQYDLQQELWCVRKNHCQVPSVYRKDLFGKYWGAKKINNEMSPQYGCGIS